MESIAWPNVFESVDDLLARSIFLMTKLVAWKSQDDQLVSVLLAEFVHLREVTDGRAS